MPSRKKFQPLEPLVSVIMPAYNAENYIKQAVESILHQSYKNLELIIINDASTDKTGDIATSYASKDKRVRVFHNKKNLKEYACRNVGLEHAKGEYIAWQDADDVSHLERLKKQLDFFAKNKTAEVVGTPMHIINNEGNILKKGDGVDNFIDWSNDIAQQHHINQFKLHFSLFPTTTCFKKSILIKINKPYFRPLQVGTDMDFIFRLKEKNTQIYNLSEKLYYYRRHPEQITIWNHLSDHYTGLSMLRYDSFCRKESGLDLINKMNKRNKLITVKASVNYLIPFLKIKDIAFHDVFFHEWLTYMYYPNKDNEKLLWVAARYQPSYVMEKFSRYIDPAVSKKHNFIELLWLAILYGTSKKIYFNVLKYIFVQFYLAHPILHKPWRLVKKKCLLMPATLYKKMNGKK